MNCPLRMPLQLPLQVRIGGCSRAGVKAENQDAFAARAADPSQWEYKGAAAIIADGVSSSRRAREASQTCVTSFLQDYFSTPDAWSVKKSVAKVLEALNAWLYHQGRISTQDALLTTCSALVIKSRTAHLFHIGDSRIYRYRQGQLEQLTDDHHYRERGRDYLARALGAGPHLEVDYRQVTVEPGDLFVLTTDGVHGWLESQALQQALAPAAVGDVSEQVLEATAASLVEQALAHSSDDNVSCLLLRVERLPAADLEETHQQLTELPIPPALTPGVSIDGYEVLEVLFSGTRSHLYRVRDTETSAVCVLKAPSVNFADDPLYLDGFIREEWVGRRLDHPGVMRVLTPVRPKRFLYYLAEYIEGQTLRQWLADHPQPSLAEVRRLVSQLIKALRALQRLDMVHQDLKPENIMLDRDGRVKIIDFGTVRVAGVDEIASPLEREIPQGSVNYVAPEYLVGEPGSFRSDLFSLAVITYELLTGELPYRPFNSRQPTLQGYGELAYIPARRRRADLPPWLDACLQKALAPNPRHRYEALSEFEHDLTVPNRNLEARYQQRPMIERNPVLFWQWVSVLLLIAQVLQWIS